MDNQTKQAFKTLSKILRRMNAKNKHEDWAHFCAIDSLLEELYHNCKGPTDEQKQKEQEELEDMVYQQTMEDTY